MAKALASSALPMIEEYLQIMFPLALQEGVSLRTAAKIATDTANQCGDFILETATEVDPGFPAMLRAELKKLVLARLRGRNIK